MTLHLLAVKPYCDRTLIPNFNSHISTKYSTGDNKPITSNNFLEMLNESFRNDWRRGICKAGSTSPASICVEGKLGDNQHLAANIEQRAVHLAFVILEDTQVYYFIDHYLDLRLAVPLSHSQQHKQPSTYFPNHLFVYCDAGTTYTLYQCSHFLVL